MTGKLRTDLSSSPVASFIFSSLGLWSRSGSIFAFITLFLWGSGSRWRATRDIVSSAASWSSSFWARTRARPGLWSTLWSASVGFRVVFNLCSYLSSVNLKTVHSIYSLPHITTASERYSSNPVFVFMSIAKVWLHSGVVSDEILQILPAATRG